MSVTSDSDIWRKNKHVNGRYISGTLPNPHPDSVWQWAWEKPERQPITKEFSETLRSLKVVKMTKAASSTIDCVSRDETVPSSIWYKCWSISFTTQGERTRNRQLSHQGASRTAEQYGNSKNCCNQKKHVYLNLSKNLKIDSLQPTPRMKTREPHKIDAMTASNSSAQVSFSWGESELANKKYLRGLRRRF